MMGTAKYLSPEQVRGRRLDGRADIYSLGLVLYECLAGRVPFLGESDADTALARLQRDPTDLGHLRPTLPIGLVNLIHKTLARNPAHRPQSGADLRAALLAVDTTPPEIDGTPADPPPRIANPPTRALGAGPGVPGDPHVSGVVPVTRHERSPDHDRPSPPDAVPPDAIDADETPKATEPIRGTPARQDQQRWTPSLVAVGVLLTAALVAAFVLFIGLNRGDEPEGLATVTVVPSDTDEATTDAGGSVPPTVTIAGSDARIVTVQAYDPDGDNGRENDAQASLAIADGSASTEWPTECYQDRFMGGKRGVGLILGLNGAATGTLRVESINAPFQIDVLTANGDTPPADVEGWTKVGATNFSDSPGTITTTIAQPAQFVLVWLTELGRDEACSESNPFRGRLGEISFGP